MKKNMSPDLGAPDLEDINYDVQMLKITLSVKGKVFRGGADTMI
jgi:hypothetical protein